MSFPCPMLGPPDNALNRGIQVDDNAGLSAVDLLELNRDLQGSRAIRLLATTNLSLYATLMERHLADGALPEPELVVRLERDLDDLDDPQSGLALIKSWAAQGWLHRIVDEHHDTNVCYLTQDARRWTSCAACAARTLSPRVVPSPMSPHASSRSPS